MNERVSQAASIKNMDLPEAGTPEFAQLVQRLQAAQTQQQQASPQQQRPQQQPQQAPRRVELGGKSIDELRLLSDLLEDVQDQLEPLRDRALDEQARLKGFAQCAEAFINIIANKAASLKKRAVEQARAERDRTQEKSELVKKPKRRTKAKKPKEEAATGGNDSSEKRRGSA